MPSILDGHLEDLGGFQSGRRPGRDRHPVVRDEVRGRVGVERQRDGFLLAGDIPVVRGDVDALRELAHLERDGTFEILPRDLHADVVAAQVLGRPLGEPLVIIDEQDAHCS